MNNTKLVRKLTFYRRLHKALKNVLDVPELKSYLERYNTCSTNGLPGQFYVRCAISFCLNSGNRFKLSPLLLHIVPMIGPLHVSLNARKTVFMFNYAFFNQIYCEVYMKKHSIYRKEV